ncbi:hypothetical protein C8Q78DRAFT_1020487 [Trametes maxima]|nr:hypothetical protein C8Q78DRAFT_1020487 [Trametes maxima]
MQKEKRIKKAEKALETQRPDLVRIEAQIKHAERKREKAQQELEKLRQTEDEQKRRLAKLRSDLKTVQDAADAAQGGYMRFYPFVNAHATGRHLRAFLPLTNDSLWRLCPVMRRRPDEHLRSQSQKKAEVMLSLPYTFMLY